MSLTRDQGPLSRKHIQDAFEFKKKYFYDDKGRLDQWKIDKFLEKIEREKNQLVSDMYESKIIEKLELDIDDLKTAKKSAEKQLREEKNELLYAFNHYLLPKINQLKLLARDSQNSSQQEENAMAILDDFVRVYSLFYFPSSKESTPRNTWGKDYNHPDFIKKFGGYEFKKNDPDYVEANNLIVSYHNQKDVSLCLKQTLKVGQYLSPKDIKVLKSCKFDLSRLDPGSNPFWKKPSLRQMTEMRSLFPQQIFPNEDDKINYKSIRFSGQASPKFEASFTRGDKKYSIKIKLGREIHSEIASSQLAQLTGFNQDFMKHYRKIKLHLGKRKVGQVILMFRRFYEFEDLPRFVEQIYNGPGEHWIEFKDVLIESHDDDNYVRLGSYDFEGWDLPNRREHRGEILFLAWLNIGDTKASNYKMLMKKNDSSPQVLYRLHDPGFSLDRSLALRKPFDLTKVLSRRDRSVNVFSKSFLQWQEEKVKVWWNDLIFRNGRRFHTSTYSDLKWMARNIASIKEEDILESLREARIVKDVADLYFQKLKNRRNEIVKAFDLKEEFALFDVPNLSKYSPNKNIHNGRLVKSFYPGHAEYETKRNNFGTFLLENISLNLPLFGLTDKFSFNLRAAELEANYHPIKIAKSALIPGVKVVISRRVFPNAQRWNTADKSRAFVIKDTLGIEYGVGSDLLEKVKHHIPISLRGYIKVYSKQIEFIHYGETRKEAYFKSFKIFQIMRQLHHYLAYDLDCGETIIQKDFYGLDLNERAAIHNPGPEILSNDISLQLQWFDSRPIHYFRDQFGVLYIYLEKMKAHTVGTSLNILDLDTGFMSFPLIGVDFSSKLFTHDSQLYNFLLPSLRTQNPDLTLMKRDYEFSVLKYLKDRKEMESLEDILNGNMDSEKAKLNKVFSLKSRTKVLARKFGLLFWGNTRKEKTLSSFEAEVPNQKNTRYFHRYSIKRRYNKRYDQIPVPDNEDILIPKGGMHEIQVEVEDKDVLDYGVHIKIQDFMRKGSRHELKKFINKLNNKFSKSKEDKFYRHIVIPQKEEVNLYRKVYSDTNIYIDSKGIKQKLLKYSPQDIFSIAQSYYKNKIPLRARRLQKYYTRLLTSENDGRKFAENLGKFINTMATRKYGLDLMKEIIGHDHMHVYGQIYGVYRSFTMLQRTEVLAGVRFAGNNWGHFDHVSPLRSFLKFQDFDADTIYVSPLVNPGSYMGTLPMPAPPMF
ncbi:MAG: hypothetical protein CMP11_03165 [Zetaproteobacteria bacterium]|nr:hypothetical protein [Pseudobdellovibrionaceae bacterium]